MGREGVPRHGEPESGAVGRLLWRLLWRLTWVTGAALLQLPVRWGEQGFDQSPGRGKGMLILPLVPCRHVTPLTGTPSAGLALL